MLELELSPQTVAPVVRLLKAVRAAQEPVRR
jgi:hypothetical protein